MIPSHYRGSCWILLAATSYATVALFGKWAFLLNIPLGAILTWRFAIAALLFWIVLQVQKPQDVSPSAKRKCFLIGFCGDALRTTLFFITIHRLGASLASLLLYTFPLFVFLFQRSIFKQPASRSQWMGLILSSAGCVLAVAPFGQSVAVDWIGVLTGLGAGITEAVYICTSDHVTKNVPASVATSYITRGALLSLSCMALALGHLALPSTGAEWTLAFSLALLATAVPIFCLMKGVQLVGAMQTSLLFTIEPVITIVLAILLFGESLTLAKILGSALILSAALLIQKNTPVLEGEPPL